MDRAIINIVLSILAKVVTPELVQKYEAILIAFLQAELAQAPSLLHGLEEAVVCKLKALASSTTTPIDDAVVEVVAHALSVDTSKCPVAPAA